jgi:hypothetical protein
MDFVVSNINDRASLLTNRTRESGHFVNVRLCATTTARDAIGSTVNVVTQRSRLSKQLVAGDGYMASNERMLQFGLGECTTIEQLELIWPSGTVSRVKNIPADTTILLIEGRPRCIVEGSKANCEYNVVTTTQSLP